MFSTTCGMWFDRVIELYDSDPLSIFNSVSRTVRTATAIKLVTPTSRVERGTTTPASFDHPFHGSKSHTQPALTSPSRNGPPADSEADTQEEISRLKRVRMISRQLREKNSNPKTNSASLSQGPIYQEPNNNASYPTEDPNIAFSATQISLVFPAPLPTQGLPDNEVEETVEDNILSSSRTSSMFANLGNQDIDIYENGRTYHNVSYPSCCCCYSSNVLCYKV